MRSLWKKTKRSWCCLDGTEVGPGKQGALLTIAHTAPRTHPKRRLEALPREKLQGVARAGGTGDIWALGGGTPTEEQMPGPRPGLRPSGAGGERVWGRQGGRRGDAGCPSGAAMPVGASLWAPNTKMHWDPGDFTDLLSVKGNNRMRRSNYCQIIEDLKNHW